LRRRAGAVPNRAATPHSTRRTSEQIEAQIKTMDAMGILTLAMDEPAEGSLSPEANASNQRALATVLMIVIQGVPRDMEFNHEHRGREAWKEIKGEFPRRLPSRRWRSSRTSSAGTSSAPSSRYATT
jgi:hypothetical protein